CWDIRSSWRMCKTMGCRPGYQITIDEPKPDFRSEGRLTGARTERRKGFRLRTKMFAGRGSVTGLECSDGMDEVVNLNRFRKRKRRETELREAERKRIVHGQTKAEKRAARSERERVEKAHAAHEREHDPPPAQEPVQGPAL